MAAIPGIAGLAFFEKYILGFGLGTAAGPSLSPYVQDLANAAWGLVQNRPLQPAAYAEMVAKSIDVGLDFHGEARKWGLDGTRFDALVQTLRQYPGVAQAMEMWRRDDIKEPAFRGWMHYHGFSDTTVDDIEKLKIDRLAPADVANAVQQGFVIEDNLLPGDVPGPPFDPPTTQVGIHALTEFTANGIDKERAQVLAELSGLPPGPVELAQMVMRNQIKPAAFFHGIREGHTKTKWGSALLHYLTTPILSAAEYATLHLKGWIDKTAMEDGGALSGYTKTQMDLLFKARGRPAAPGQMATAVARGIDGPDGVPMNQAQFQKGIQESDIRPEWGPMLWGIRYAYPPLFQINRLVQAGAIDPATAVVWARKDRYAPEVVAALEAYWTGGSTTTAVGPDVKKAQTQLWTKTHSSFIAQESDDAAARARFDLIGIPGADQSAILALWESERSLIRAQLSPADIRKAYQQVDMNAATGKPWTRDDALTALLDRGWGVDDANSYLDIPYKG